MDTNNDKKPLFFYSELLACLKSAFFITGVSIALFVWILDPFINAVYLQQGTIYQQLIQPDTYDLVFRLVISTTIIIFSFFGSVLLNRSRQAEAALQSSEKRFRALYDNNPNMFFTIDEYGKVLSVNQFGIDHLGYTKNQLVGKSVINVFYEEDRPLAQEYLKQCFAEPDKVHNWELRKIRQDRSVFYVRETIRVMDDVDGKPTALVVCEDITERKQTEVALSRSHRALMVLNKCNQALIHAREEQGLLDEVCQMIIETGGYRFAWVGFPEQDERKTVRSVAQAGYEDGYLDTIVVTWADDQHGHGPVGTAIRTGKSSIIKNIWTNPDFTPWRESAIEHGYSSVASLPLNFGGLTIGALAIYASEVDAFDAGEVKLLEDLANNLSYGIISLRTEIKRKQVEEILRISEEKFATAFRNSPVAIALSTLSNARLLDISDNVEQLFGYRRDDLIGQSALKLGLWSDPESRTRMMKALQDQGRVQKWEADLRIASGEIPNCEISAEIINIGNEPCMLAVIQDVTARKQAEEERIKLEQQPIQVEKMDAIGQLTGGIAHDFNNLLSIISGNLRFLQQDIGQNSVEIDELFEDAMSAVDDGAALTQRLLGFSRDRALQPEIKNVNDTIEKFIRFLSRTLGKSIALDTELADEDLFINVDPSQLENALLNLSINARDAMPEGGTITLSATRYHHGDGEGEDLILPEGDYIKITVTDTGAGIRSEDLPYVYEPFFTTKGVGQGSGLGLSMVYGFTQQSNGGCHISSAPGKGTTVSLYFPEVMDNKNIDKKPEDDEELSMRSSEVILVVEDEARVRRVTLRDLKKLGYKTLEAGNAEMAKTMIESGEPIDLLFSDILMPGEMNGHKLALWTAKNFPEIKIILTSGYNKGEADVHRNEAHPFLLMRKPYSIDKLAKQIRTTLAE